MKEGLMATLAAVSGQPDTVYGDRRIAFRDLTFSNSYTTGGEALTPAQVGMSTFAKVDVDQGTVTAKFDYANNKVQAFVVPTTPNNSLLVEVPNTTNLSTITLRTQFIGR